MTVYPQYTVTRGYTAALVNGKVSLTKWLRLLQCVKQGATLSMLLYICFINGLIEMILKSNLGCHVLDLNCGCLGYADDLAFIALNKNCMQQMIDMAFDYSCKWRFKFSPSKCGVVIFNNDIIHERFFLGGRELTVLTEYNHVGVNVNTRGKETLMTIRMNISNCNLKVYMYSLIGSSLYRTALSPITLAKVYLSVGVPHLLSNVEVRCFDEGELDEHEVFHRNMAKEVQNLPQNTANPAELATVGWRSLRSYIDLMKKCLCSESCYSAILV